MFRASQANRPDSLPAQSLATSNSPADGPVLRVVLTGVNRNFATYYSFLPSAAWVVR